MILAHFEARKVVLFRPEKMAQMKRNFQYNLEQAATPIPYKLVLHHI